MGKCSSDIDRTVQMHSPSTLSKYRLPTNLSKINNEEHTMHRRRSCAIASKRAASSSSNRLKRPTNVDTDRNVLSSSLVKLTPHVPTQFKVYGPQKRYKLNAIDAHGTCADRQNAHNNNVDNCSNSNHINGNDNKRRKIDRWTAERLLLLRGDDTLASSTVADNDNGNHLIDLSDAANSRITWVH